MLIIITWMLIFALIHSATADKRVKDWFIQRLGERRYQGFYRLAYNALSVLMLAPIFLYTVMDKQMLWQVNGTLALFFRLLQVMGVIGLTISLLQIDWRRFAGLKQMQAYFSGASLPLADEALQTGGLYAFVRHPLYFFSLMLLWFSPSMTQFSFFFNIMASLYFIFGSIMEEGRMVKAYGKDYQDYQAKVAWLIPFTKRLQS